MANKNFPQPPNSTSVVDLPQINSMPKMQNTRREKADLISRLLSHFWTADDPVQIRQAQIADWLEDLAEFEAAVVRAACREWRQTQTKRPLPADLRRLCIEHQRNQHLSLPAPEVIPLTEAECRQRAAATLAAGYSVVVDDGAGKRYRFTPEYPQ